MSSEGRTESPIYQQEVPCWRGDDGEGIDVSRLFRLDGRVALITGGTRGIGRAIAEGFGLAGARVVVASRKPEACAETEAALRSVGIDAIGIACHMGSLSDVHALVAATVERFGGIDVVVNNAANALAEPIGSFTEAGVTKSIDVNVKGPLFLIQESLPYFRVLGSCVGDQYGFGGSLALLCHGRPLRRRQSRHGLVHQVTGRWPGPRRHSGQRPRPRSRRHGHDTRHWTSSHRRYGSCLPATTGGERRRDGGAGTLPRSTRRATSRAPWFTPTVVSSPAKGRRKSRGTGRRNCFPR